MVSDERLYLELNMGSLLRKLTVNQNQIPVDKLRTVYRKGYEALCMEIKQTAQEYIKAVVCAGLCGNYLQNELTVFYKKLEAVVNGKEVMHHLQAALFQNPDMERVKELTAGIKSQAESIAKEYQSHARN